uniref:FGENESH: predicted gene_8.110 protein n=1 Tax=Rhodotorula toruloides TaxID=5286 RepID=A0A0K3CFB2_RHOTO
MAGCPSPRHACSLAGLLTLSTVPGTLCSSPPAMTAWRTSPSRPAPPISSESPNHPTRDSLFAGPSHSHSPSTSRPSSSLSASGTIGSRTLTSSSSAYSLLARKKAEMDDEDDRMSVRSGLSSRSSSLTLSGKGEGTAKGRNRAASSASSVATMRGLQGARIEDDDDRMEVDEQPVGPDEKGKGKAKNTAETGAAKRQRLRPPMPDFTNPSTRPNRSNSTSPGNIVSPSQPTLSTTSADDLMPSMKRKPNRAPSISSLSSRPRPMTSTSSATLRPPSSPSKPASLASKDASTFDSPSLSTSPSETVSSAASVVSKRRSWFGNPADPRPPPIPPSAASSNDAVPTAAPFDPTPPADSAEAAPAPASSAQPETNRGWLSLLSRARPSMPDLAGPAAKQGVDEAETTPTQERPMELDAQSKEEEVREIEAEEAPTTPTATQRGALVPLVHTSVFADAASANLLGPEAAPAESSASQSGSRLSWFGWSRPAPPATDLPPSQKTEDEAAAPERPPPAPVAPETSEDQTEPPPAELAVTTTSEQQAPAASSEQRGWLSGCWGGAGQSAEELAAQRRRELWALKLASQRSANKLIEAVPEDEEMAPSSGEATATVTPATNDETPTPTPTPSQPLKHKPSGSWSIFSRTPASASSVPAGTSPTKSMLSLRAPLGGLGISSSSAASTRSRTSSHNGVDTAPSSPQLRAQSDQGPVKPLTGSIRSSPRQRPSSAFEAPPPVENLVLPTFNDTFLRPPRSFAPKKSTLTRAVSVVSSYFFHRPPTEESTSPRLVQAQQAAGFNPSGMLTEMRDDPAERLPKSLDVMSEGPMLSKVKRVVTIGVHGWFTSNNMCARSHTSLAPRLLTSSADHRIKSLMGEQTGTSVKFATMMHDAVHSYLESHDVSSFNIQAIALEGQGEVEDRVNKLYSQLVGREEWLKAIKMADAVFVATHSQGSVVSTQLLARMLDQGLITGTQTHLCVSHALSPPLTLIHRFRAAWLCAASLKDLSIALAPYFNYLESAPARELFAFQDAESVPAIKFIDSLRIILNAGVKLTVVGSLNDQVVPLYSALFSGVSHPAILRAVYIDSDAFRTSDFLANLIVFAIRLRNAGLSDHDLVYHVSEALAGALTGVGHSKIYEEEVVYKLAVRYHFETTHLTEPPTHLDTRTTPPPLSMSFNPRDRRNPYLLTWALRGIIEDPQVRELFSNELVALREAYETWKPQTKVLKDVKLKLEGIRMMSWRGGKL